MNITFEGAAVVAVVADVLANVTPDIVVVEQVRYLHCLQPDIRYHAAQSQICRAYEWRNRFE